MENGKTQDCQKTCKGEKCLSCGLNPAVSKVRKARIRAGEMKINKKGLKYLPLHGGL